MQGYRIQQRSALNSSWRSLALFLTMCFTVAFLGSLITEPSLAEWYTKLEKPVFTPPGWVFGAAWSFLYSSMAVAMWRVWMQRNNHDIFNATVFYHLQLFLNLLWTIAFFGMHNPGLALADICMLQLSNFATAIYFFRIDKFAGVLLAPYLLWISFATVLNFYIWVSN